MHADDYSLKGRLAIACIERRSVFIESLANAKLDGYF